LSASLSYPELDQLFSVYLSQDYAYWGDTVEAVMASYMRDSTVENHQALLNDIERFMHSHQDDLDAAFDAAYGDGVGPELCGHTTASFFIELKRLIELPVNK
jgi:hypothetical protein